MNELLNRFMTMLRPQSAQQVATSPLTVPQAGMLNRLFDLATTQTQGAMQAAPEQLARSRQMLADWQPGQEISPELMNQFMGLAAFSPMGMTKAIPGYGMTHRPMAEAGGASRLHEAYKSFGEDIYSPKALQYFGSGDPREAGIVKLLKIIKDNPQQEVTIYRGIPKGAPKEINAGDWVTLDKSVASEYGSVISKKVKAQDVTTWPDALLEFGYFPK